MTLEVQSRCGRVRLFCIKNVLPLGILVALMWALAWPLPGEVISRPKLEGYRIVSTTNVLIIFVISGLTLKTDDIKKAMGKEEGGDSSTELFPSCASPAAWVSLLLRFRSTPRISRTAWRVLRNAHRHVFRHYPRHECESGRLQRSRRIEIRWDCVGVPR